MSLVLGVGAFCDWDKALPVLTALDFNEGQARAVGRGFAQALADQQSAVAEGTAELQALFEELEKYPSQQVVLFYSDLADVLVHVINVEQDVADSIKEWQLSLKVLQDFYRKHRKQTFLFNLQEVLEQPQLFLEVCAKEWGYTVDTAAISIEVGKAESWSQLLARDILDDDEELSYVLQHTKVMTWPLGASEETELDGQSGALDLLSRLQSYVTVNKNLTQQQACNRELAEENRLVRIELKALQTKHAQVDTEKVTLSRTLSDSKDLLKKSNLNVESLQKDNKELSVENQLILDELHLIQKELEKQILELKSEQEEFKTLRAKYTQLDSEKSQLNTTVSDLQAQLKKSRAQIELLQKDKEVLAEKNNSVSRQLSVKSEDLEKQLLKFKSEQEESKTLRAKYTQLDLEKGKLNTTVSDLQAQLKKSRAQIELLQQDKAALTKECSSALGQLSLIEKELEKQILDVKVHYSLN